jgi:signal transduction histidine kinase
MRVRARAVDMLGRQQIAGIPTAIHELFKNAHDAYAERVRVDYIHSLDLFVLRDNGLGMTKEDLESRWLTLGTESKVGQNDPTLHIWTGPENLPRRPSLGEKGIGRLAIAAIGPQVFVYSRALREDGPATPVCALVNWSLFEQPGLDLDQIEVPVVEVEDVFPPTRAIIQGLVAQSLANLENLGDSIAQTAHERVARELRAFDFDPDVVYRGLGEGLLGKPYGTHFLIKPTAFELGLDLSLSRLSGFGASPLQRYLLGFGNTMHGAGSAPPIVAEFVEHRADGSSQELIGPFSFFTPEEFNSADHHISGRFDEFGTFHGAVRIYDQVEHDYTLAPPDDLVGRTDCGPFDVSFAYVQGSARDTKMQLDEWKLLGDKLESIGGLYVYRDGVRILPYGNSDFDWLGIERRRTLSAQDWFFSYRRIIGDVRLSHHDNANLVEKAGREGFRQNKAYRQMVALLESLFARLAIDFFRDNARVSSDYGEMRRARQRDYEILQKRARSVKGAKDAFNEALSKFFDLVRAGDFELRCDEVRRSVLSRLDGLARVDGPIAAGEQLLLIETDFNATTKTIREAIAIGRPRQFGLSKRQQRDYQAYLSERDRLMNKHYHPMIAVVSERIHELLASGRTEIDPRRRLDEPVRRESEFALSSAGDARKRVSATLDLLDVEIRNTINRSWSDLSTQVETVKSDLARTEVASLSPEEIERRRDKLIDQVRGSAERSTQLMDALGEQLKSVMEGINNQGNLFEVAAALESENDELKERVDQYADLAQIGLALGLVQHEFAGQVRNINRALDALRPWATRNRGADEMYSKLRISFEHLESYLQLFVPLNRRLQRRRVPVSGMEIEEFVRTVFGPRFERHRVMLIVPEEFSTATVTTFPSTILPVFANVIDNAIHWLAEVRDLPRVITLGVDDHSMRIGNSGPGVDPRDAETMFEFGATTKPGGRGMGLYLSQDALRKESMSIRLERAGVDVHPIFVIDVPEGTINMQGGE